MMHDDILRSDYQCAECGYTIENAPVTGPDQRCPRCDGIAWMPAEAVPKEAQPEPAPDKEGFEVA